MSGKIDEDDHPISLVLELAAKKGISPADLMEAMTEILADVDRKPS